MPKPLPPRHLFNSNAAPDLFQYARRLDLAKAELREVVTVDVADLRALCGAYADLIELREDYADMEHDLAILRGRTYAQTR